MNKILITILYTFISFTFVFSQHQELNEKPAIWKSKDHEADSNSLLSAFKKGVVSGHFRYFFMATDNTSGLSDYYANAFGGGIKYETAPFKHFQLGVSGFFIYNIGSSPLHRPDPHTQQMNRYEIGLFDIQDPLNKNDIDRLEEFYLRYIHRNVNITFGKQLINTPFINLQDGRMRPTEVEGLWIEYTDSQKISAHAGYIYRISPRSTVKWFSVAESIGIYPSGVNPDGTRSGYPGNLNSKGIFLANFSFPVSKNWRIQFWNQFTENIFNSAFLGLQFDKNLAKQTKFRFEAQAIRQDAVKDGGNKDASKTYFEKNGKAFTFGFKTGLLQNKSEYSFSYNRITKAGRYLMPREWGRDPFFTFMPRERNEGLADVHAVVVAGKRKFLKSGFTASLAYGGFDLPQAADFRKNKYGMPSYHQLNIDLQHKFKGFLKGLEAQFLYVYKRNTEKNVAEKYLFNKADMSLWNVVFNYRF
ncbi:MAG: OprD family outer membrane porin [Chitinophagaceae bacterium]|nr:OprD family outer membrane porin [Chitinophagaceae bacterium]